jgi:hypothetical protein
VTRSRNRRSSQTSKGARTGIIPHQIINAQAACPRPLVRAALFALLGLLGLLSLIVSPWTGVVLILVAGTGAA